VINSERVVRDVVAIGASAGGVEALVGLLSRLPVELPATIAIVVHRNPHAESRLEEVLARSATLPVSEARQDEAVREGMIYLAPRDRHLMLDGRRWRLDRGPKQHLMRPAVDPLFTSLARALGPRVIGVLLSGAGHDGVEGLTEIKARGGLSLAQHPSEARHPYMPVHAIHDDDVDGVLRVGEMAEVLAVLARGGSVPPGDADQKVPAQQPA
jgi:two-component system, chemotaxis family, protein-glutamate methylesterase/glutaminase